MTNELSTTSVSIPQLAADHQDVLNECMAQIAAKSRRNKIRRQYYDHKNTLRDLGISIPASLKNVETVIGWPAKGVNALGRRITLDGFTSPGASTDDLGLESIFAANRLEVEAPQAHTSSMISSVAFLSVTAGDIQSGDPEVLITARSAELATGLWDGRRRTLKAGLAILDVDATTGAPTEFVLYVPNLAIIAKYLGPNRWDVRQSRHELGVPMEPLVYDPSLDRPFGRSRISRTAMALTDSGVRTLLRSEVSAEFFNAPQRYALGVDEESFVDRDGNPIPAWTSLVGRITALSRDEDGNVPEVGQFPQQSMVPNFDQLRGLASLFAADQNLPLDSLGIVHDNPSSADAIMRSKEELVLDAKSAIRSYKPSWERVARLVGLMLDNSPAAVAEYAKLRAHFENPATPSIVSVADAAVKEISAMPWLADSPVMLERFGHDADEIDRLLADKRRAGGSAALRAITEAASASRSAVSANGAVSGS